MRKRVNLSANYEQDNEAEEQTSRASKPAHRRSCFDERDPDMKMKEYSEDDNNATSFFSYLHPVEIEQDLIEAFNSYGVAYIVHSDKRKILLNQQKQNQGEVRESVQMKVELIEAREQILVQFKRKGGSTMMFHALFNQIKQQMNVVNKAGVQTPTWQDSLSL